MKTHVQKWGNSLAVRIPRAIAQETGLREDSPVDLTLEDGTVVVRPVVGSRYSLRKLLAGVSRSNVHKETDFGGAMGDESW